MSPSEDHPLAGAVARVERAQRHIAELRGELDKEAEQITVQVSEGRADEPDTRRLGIGLPGLKIDPTVGVRVGETIYNLRAALDYVVYALACANNGGRHVAETQFPVEDKEEMFEARRTGRTPDGRSVRRYLNKVADEDVDALRALQPFSGCTWPKALIGMSNPDKHSRLTPLDPQIGVTDPRFPVRRDETKYVSLADLGARFDLIFVESSDPVLEILEFFHTETSGVVSDFQRALDLRPSTGN